MPHDADLGQSEGFLAVLAFAVSALISHGFEFEIRRQCAGAF
jgi:hypothetical protein